MIALATGRRPSDRHRRESHPHSSALPARGKTSPPPRRRAGSKRGQKGSDAPGDKASIRHILACTELRCVRHGRRSTWVEEFLVQWGPEHCTFGEALEQYYMEFGIVSFTSLKNTVSTLSLLPFVAAKRASLPEELLSPSAPGLLSCFLADAPRRTGPVPVAPGRLQIPHPTE